MLKAGLVICPRQFAKTPRKSATIEGVRRWRNGSGVARISYSKLLDPVSDIISCMESILSGAFGGASGDQRECYKRIHAYSWGLHTLVMDVITAVGIENAATRPAVLERFNSLKRPIKTNLDNLVGGFDGTLTDEQHEVLAFVITALAGIERMMRNLWHYSLLRHKRIAYDIRGCEIAPLLNAARRLQDFALPSSLDGIGIRGDARWLSYAFEEIAANTRQHGALAELRVMAKTRGDHIQIVFSDKGPGFRQLPDDDPFSAFWQADDRCAGLGLGLFLAREFITACGGDIAIDSGRRTGTEVTVSLRPCQPAALGEA